MKRKSLVTVFALLLFTMVQAQNVKEATWLATLGETVSNVRTTQLNIPLIELRSGNVVALDPTTGNVLWKSDLRFLSEVTPIEGTPFSLVKNREGLLLLNINDGKTIDISKQIQGKLDSWYLIPETYDLVFYSKGPDAFLVVDLFNFIIRYNQPATFSEKAGGAAAKLSKFGLSVPSNDVTVLMECPPISNRAGGLIFAGAGKLTNVDPAGRVIWQVDQPKKKKGGMIKSVDNQTEMLTDENSDVFYIQKSKNMMAVKISDGSPAWSDFYEIKGNEIIDTGNGLLPIMRYTETAPGQGGGMFNKSKINLVDAATGKAVWPAELELKGYIDQYRMLDDHTLAIVTFNQTNSRFQIIDLAQGKFRYPNEIELKGRVIDFIPGSQKIVFATSKGLDIFDAASGKDLLPGMTKFDSDADIMNVYRGTMAYNIDAKNRKVYVTDLTKGGSMEIVKNFKFDANEPLLKYDVLPNGNIFLASAHHMQVYSPTGVQLKNVAFDFTGKGNAKFDNALAVVDKVTNTVFMVTSIAASAAVLGIGEMTGTQAAAAQTTYELMAPELAAHDLARNERAAKYYLSLKKMKKDPTSIGSFFVRRDKDAKANYLSYVSKDDGTVIFDIPLAADSDEPEFVIDDAVGFLYYAPRFSAANADWMFATKKEKTQMQKTAQGIVGGYQY